ncbi:MAG: putative aminohydrolase SsnA [Spirochaetales bacterium]|nr:putative aminohydrolase SsnA [Spirochaetales bacterium]
MSSLKSKDSVILIQGATAVEFDPPRVRDHVDVVINGGKIAAVGAGAGQNITADEVIDGSGRIVFPGIVCSHHHIYSALSRGILANIGPTPDFVSILKNLWWRLDQAIDAPSLRSSTLVASMDALRCGTTAIIDHHASPAFIEGSLDVIREGMETIGVRGATCYEVTDRHGRDGMIAGIEENRRFALECQASSEDHSRDQLVEAMIGGHAPCTLPEEAYERMAAVIQETGRGLHLHVAEDAYDVSHSHVTYGEDIMARLDRHGMLDSRTLLVHGVHLSEAEIELLNARDGFLAHNARSNMNNNVGYNHNLPKVRNLALGTDGIGADMYTELQTAYFKHKDEGGIWWPGNFLGALQAGNRLLERLFGESFGRLEPGYMADVVIARYSAPTPLVPENVAGHFVFGQNAGITETVIVNGKIVMKNGVFPSSLDEQGITREAREHGRVLWERMDAIAP